MTSPAQFVWYYQRRLLSNAARHAWARHRRDTLVIAIGGGLLLAHELDVIRAELAENAAALAAHRFWLIMSACATAGVAGILRGRSAMQSAASLLSRPWLAALPWQSEAMAQARLFGCILPGSTQTAVTATLAALLFSWASWRNCCAATLLCATAFAAGFFVMSLAMHRRPDRPFAARANDMIEARRGPFLRMVAPIDRARPAWCGSWAAARLRRRSGVLLFGLTAIVMGVGCTIAVAQAWPFLAVAAGWAAAHLVFLIVMNALPLASPALRAQPIGFVPAAFAILRVPFTLSLLAFAAAGTIAVAALSAPPGLVAAAAGLLLLANTIAGITAIGLPTQRGLAIFLYASSVLLTLYEQLEYGYAIYICLAAFIAFMFLQGRRSFYAR